MISSKSAQQAGASAPEPWLPGWVLVMDCHLPSSQYNIIILSEKQGEQTEAGQLVLGWWLVSCPQAASLLETREQSRNNSTTKQTDRPHPATYE